MKRNPIGLLLVIALLASAANPMARAAASPVDGGRKPVVAIAWRKNLEGGIDSDALRVQKYIDAECFTLGQVVYAGAPYEANVVSDECVQPSGMLREECAQGLRADWENSNVAEVVAARDFDLILFLGGEDVSPSLQASPDVERNAGEAYNATRDISDYILMRYCLRYDVPVLCICRGMQMLAVASGGELLQDIPAYFAEMGKADREYHRMNADRENRNFVAHDVVILDRGSLLYRIAQTDVIRNAPSWHHQSVRSVEGTSLAVAATTTIDGVEIVEAIERTDRRFALGMQFHIEAVIERNLNGEANDGGYTDKSECVAFFRRLIDYVLSLETPDAAA